MPKGQLFHCREEELIEKEALTSPLLGALGKVQETSCGDLEYLFRETLQGPCQIFLNSIYKLQR